jgi:hypothetical protein
MIKPIEWGNPQVETYVFVRVEGEANKYKVETGDYLQDRLEVIHHLDCGFKRHGAVLALVP